MFDEVRWKLFRVITRRAVQIRWRIIAFEIAPALKGPKGPGANQLPFFGQNYSASPLASFVLNSIQAHNGLPYLNDTPDNPIHRPTIQQLGRTLGEISGNMVIVRFLPRLELYRNPSVLNGREVCRRLDADGEF